jgi:hypothetical protein
MSLVHVQFAVLVHNFVVVKPLIYDDENEEDTNKSEAHNK